MIICTNCGNHNEDSDEFCGSCGKFLEWVGQKVEEPAETAAPEAEPEPEEVKVGLIDRVKAAVGIEAGSSGSAGLAEAPSGGEAPPAAPVDPAAEAEEARARAAAAEQERARLEADAADQAERERQATLDAEEAERQRHLAAEAAAAAAEAQAAADAAAREAAEEQARRHAEAAERERAAAAAEEAARAAERERVAAEAAAGAAEAAERERLEAEARAATEAAERERLAAEAEATAAAAAREAEERARQEAEETAAKARAEEEARRAAQAEETRRRAEEERTRREAEARAEAARRAAALLAQPKPQPQPEPPASDAGDVAAPLAASTPVAPAPPKRAAPAPPPAHAGAQAGSPTAMAPSQEPAKPKAPPKPATQKAADDGPKPGDLVCDSCGTGNDPARKFCRRCGNSLAKAEPVKKLPWWKRLFQRRKGPKPRGGGKGRKAATGARQASFKAEMAMARVRNGLLLLAALGVGGAFMVPSLRTSVMNGARDGIDKARDTLFPNFDPVRPVSVVASTELPDHRAVQAADLATNTYWSEAAEGEGIGQTVTFTFGEPVELAKILVTPGALDPNQPDLFLRQPRPREVHLVFDNGSSTDITLKDEVNKAQTFSLKAKGITTVQLSITSVYPGTGGQDTSIAEVEFRKRG